MREPSVSIPVRELLAEMAADIRTLRNDVHEIQISQAASTATAVADVADTANGRARWALWVAALSGPASAVLTYVLTRH